MMEVYQVCSNLIMFDQDRRQCWETRVAIGHQGVTLRTLRSFGQNLKGQQANLLILMGLLW